VAGPTRHRSHRQGRTIRSGLDFRSPTSRYPLYPGQETEIPSHAARSRLSCDQGQTRQPLKIPRRELMAFGQPAPRHSQPAGLRRSSKAVSDRHEQVAGL